MRTSVWELETPSLLIDLDRVERNLIRWQEFCNQRGVVNTPHVKTHKIPELAKLQIQYGAKGVTCQKLGEAEAMAEGGVKEILLAYNIIGREKLKRLSSLHQEVRLRVVTDSEVVLEGLKNVGSPEHPLRVLVECDTGMHRIGVPSPEKAVSLATKIMGSPGLEFSGFCTYPASPSSQEFFKEVLEQFQAKGFQRPEISGGGTPGMWNLGGDETLTEYRAGTYIYNDRIIVSRGTAQWEDCAMSVLMSVVSTTGEDWVTVDGGTKALTTDQYGQTGFGCLLGDPDTLLTRCSEEHGVLQRKESKPDRAVGDKVRIIPNHACVVSNLFDTAYGIRGDEVVAQWKITARGKLQ